jgi:hypothetical protein
MTTFDVIYHFCCPLCRHINIGKLTYEATDAENASYNLRAHPPACEFCSPVAPEMATITALVFLAEAEQV